MIDFNKLVKEYSFLWETPMNEQDVYFCNCGYISIHDRKEKATDLDSEQVSHLYPEKNESSEDYDDLGFDELYKSIKMGMEDKIKCHGCNKNFATLENQKKLIPINNFFISNFEFEDNDENLFIVYRKYKMLVTIDEDKKEIKQKYVLNLLNEKKYIRFEKNTKKLFFKDFANKEIEFDLNKVIFYSKKMFESETKIIYDIYNLQVYIGLLAKYVIDVNNANVVTELLNETRGIINYAGLDIIQKIISIFFGIIKYNNLSTIALTKGGKFLYDLMIECDIPTSSEMIESKATSPIKIFNFLVANYINKINEEVNADNQDAHEFIFKSKTLIQSEEEDKKTETPNAKIKHLDEEVEMKIKYNKNNNYKRKVKNNTNSSGYEVLTITEDAGASKYIYKLLRSFQDFKQILKYFKFYNKHEIINLLQKYDLNFLVEFIDIIYFRDKIPIKELYKIITIVEDFVKEKTLEITPTLDIDNITLQYSIVKDFDFTFYDDCIMMMEVLDFDPKRQFTKIKKYIDLMEYHDNLVKFFNVVSNKEKNKKFIDFVERFRFLENKDNYDGPLEIKLIDSPAMLIAEGVQMKHSASSYSKKVINNIYLIGQVFDKSPNLDSKELKRFTIGFSFHRTQGLQFDQVKGYANKQGSNRFKKLLMEFLEAKDISYKPLKDLKLKAE